MIITKISFLALSVLYVYMGHIFIQSMESTKVADLGHYHPDVIVFWMAIVCFVFATFSLLFVAFLTLNLTLKEEEKEGHKGLLLKL